MIFAYIAAAIILCLRQDIFFSYTVFAVPLIITGLYFYMNDNLFKRKRMLYILFLGLACAVNYFSAFLMLALIAADNSMRAAGKCAALVTGLIPVTLVYITQHFIFQYRIVCFWIPDFQLWNLLFEKHCLDGFYWFWTAYFLFIAMCPVIAMRSQMTYRKLAAVCGIACYGMMIFFAGMTPDFAILLLPFSYLMTSIHKNTESDFADRFLKIVLLMGPLLMCLDSPDYDYGILGRIVKCTLGIFSGLGVGAILCAITLLAGVYYVYRTIYPESKDNAITAEKEQRVQ